MPAEIIADATVPCASRNVDPSVDDNIQSSSLSSVTLNNDDGHHVSSLGPTLAEELDSTNKIYSTRKHVYMEEIPDEDAPGDIASQQAHIFAEARASMTVDQHEHIDNRVENIHAQGINVPANQPRESSQDKGKGADPRNWGALQLNRSDTELGPQVQWDMLAEFNSHRNLKAYQLTDAPTPIPSAKDSNVSAAGSDVSEPGGSEPELTRKDVMHEEILAYLKDKKKLMRELDCQCKKDKAASRKRKDRAGSLPLSGELATLIEKVDGGSKSKQQYKPTTKKSNKIVDLSATTKPVTQMTSKSPLGHVFGHLGKRQHDE
ncbi:hypothetical protein DXG01_001086 [Tephrocybe rancida]|nr:hypothetical protein DXG01_001086 [Tephrocybe rancida]